MTQAQVEVAIPDWSLGWRLRRSLESGAVSAKQMAAELDVSEGTISRWCHDVGAPPRAIYLRHWAYRCKVPLSWLAEGEEQAPAGGFEPSQPADYRFRALRDRPITDSEIEAVQDGFRGLIRRGTFTHLIDRLSAELPIASNQ